MATLNLNANHPTKNGGASLWFGGQAKALPHECHSISTPKPIIQEQGRLRVAEDRGKRAACSAWLPMADGECHFTSTPGGTLAAKARSGAWGMVGLELETERLQADCSSAAAASYSRAGEERDGLGLGDRTWRPLGQDTVNA